MSPAPLATAPRPRVSRSRLYLAALAIFALDQLTKGMIERLPAGINLTVIPHFFRLVQVFNRGAAFGFLQNSSSPYTLGSLIAVSLIALAVVFSLLWQSSMSRRSGWALAMILGGACGNLFDRILHGRVTDFLLFYLGRYEWPAFNVADSAIVIGATLLIWEIAFQRHPEEQARPATEAETPVAKQTQTTPEV